MSVGNSRKYKIREIHGRHFLETGKEAGLPPSLVRHVINEIQQTGESVFDLLEASLPSGFPEKIHACVKVAALNRLRTFSELTDE